MEPSLGLQGPSASSTTGLEKSETAAGFLSKRFLMQPRNSRPWRHQTYRLVCAFMDHVCCFLEQGTPELGLE